jgi:hypothetical protein
MSFTMSGPASGNAIMDSVYQASHGFSVGQWLYNNGTDFVLASTASTAASQVVGVVTAVINTNVFTIAYAGRVDTLSGLTAGATYYLSGTAGQITATDPSATFNSLSKPVLVALTATSGVVINQRGIVNQTGGAPRERLTAARTYYVRTDGSDSNNGLTNTAGGAFLTIQHAANVVSNTLDLGANSVTIQVADGAYNAAVVLGPFLGSSTVIVRGNTTTPANVTITTTATALQAHYAGDYRWHVEGFKISTSGSFNDCLRATRSTLSFQAIDFASAGGNHVQAAYGSLVNCTGNYTISGGAVHHLYAYIGGIVEMRSVTATLTGSPAFSTAFAEAYASGLVEAVGITFSGTATGKRYQATANAVVQSGGGGANYFPGNAAGTLASGGQYL